MAKKKKGAQKDAKGYGQQQQQQQQSPIAATGMFRVLL
jgi:hypothetical protein